MLARYKMWRGKRPAGDPLPDGVRMDTRKHTRHFLRPDADLVKLYLSAPSNPAWSEFRKAYLASLATRFDEDRTGFDALAERARREDVYIGCSCPTTANPDVTHCHTVLALGFMRQRYPDLGIVLP